MKKYRNGQFASLKDVLEDMIDDLKIGNKLNEAKIKQLWLELLGEYIFKQTQRIYFFKGKLFIQIESAALKQELFMAKDKIKDNLNEKLAEKLIFEIIFK